MSQVDEADIRDPSKFSLIIHRVIDTDDFSRYKFKLTCIANSQFRFISTSLTTAEIEALPSQTQKAKFDAAYAKALGNIRSVAYELSQESSYTGQDYFST